MQKNQWKTSFQLRKIQDIKLRKLIHHAYKNVPYYKRLFNSIGLGPEDVKTAEDLRKLPTTSKEQLRSPPLDDIIAEGINLKKCRYSVTSGSTGVPLEMYFTKRDFTLMNLSLIRSFLAHNIKPWHKILDFTGDRYIPKKKPWYENIGIFRRFWLSTYQDPGVWIHKTLVWKPHIILGYALNLKLLAHSIQEKGVKSIRPNIVFSTSGLLDNETRKLLESTFQTRVVDLYGARESGFIAWECSECHGYHINSDMVIVEFLKDGKIVSPGEEGEVVVTNLHSFAMPFIRYKLGDIGIPSAENPTCGRNLPLMKTIKGRIADYIRLPSGEVISPHPFYIIMESAKGIKEWKIIQESIDELLIEFIRDTDFSSEVVGSIYSQLSVLTHNEIVLNIIAVDKIRRETEGKMRSVVSTLETLQKSNLSN